MAKYWYRTAAENEDNDAIEALKWITFGYKDGKQSNE